MPPHYLHIPFHPVLNTWQTPLYSPSRDNDNFIPDPYYKFPPTRNSIEKVDIDNLALLAPNYDNPLLNLLDPSSGMAAHGGYDFSGPCLPLKPELLTAPENIDTCFLECDGPGGVYGITHSMGWE